MKAIKLFIISVLLLSSFQALAVLITERMNAVENKDQIFRLHSIKTISYVESSDREQFIISKTGITLKKQNYEALDNKTLYIKVDIVLTSGVYLRLYVIFTVLDVVDEVPKNIQLSNSTILNGSAAYSLIGQITANDADSDNTKLEYSLSGVDKEYFLLSSSKRLIIKNKVDMAVKSRYSIEIHVSDPAGNSASKEFTITVEPNLAITTTDISTPENADKVINLTTNRGGADFLIAGGADENKFSLSGTTLTFEATDFEARDDKTYSVEITANRAGTNGGANEHATKTITVTVTDLDDEAPTDIQINDAVFIDGYVSLADDKGANFLIGTLTATDDTADNELTFTTISTDFKIVNNNELRTKHPLTTTALKHVTITASDGTRSFDKTFAIKVVASSQVFLPEITNTDVSVVENGVKHHRKRFYAKRAFVSLSLKLVNESCSNYLDKVRPVL